MIGCRFLGNDLIGRDSFKRQDFSDSFFIENWLFLMFIFLVFVWTFSTLLSPWTICTSWLTVLIWMVFFFLLFVWFSTFIFVMFVLALLAVTFTRCTSTLWWIICSTDPFIWIIKCLTNLWSLMRLVPDPYLTHTWPIPDPNLTRTRPN